MDDDASVPGPAPDEQGLYTPDPDEPAGVAELDDDRARREWRAYQLAVREGQSITYVAEALGVSRTTAWRMVQKGKARAQLHATVQQEEIKQVQLAQLAAMRAWLYADARALGTDALKVVPVLLDVLKTEAKIAGSLAPTAHTVTAYPGPDPRAIAEIEATFRSVIPAPPEADDQTGTDHD